MSGRASAHRSAREGLGGIGVSGRVARCGDAAGVGAAGELRGEREGRPMGGILVIPICGVKSLGRSRQGRLGQAASTCARPAGSRLPEGVRMAARARAEVWAAGWRRGWYAYCEDLSRPRPEVAPT